MLDSKLLFANYSAISNSFEFLDVSSASVDFSIDSLSSTFSLELSKPTIKVIPGSVCFCEFLNITEKKRIRGQIKGRVLQGIVERNEINYGTNSLSQFVSGRDWFSLIISSNVYKPRDYSGRTLEYILNDTIGNALKNSISNAGGNSSIKWDNRQIDYYPSSIKDEIVPKIKADAFDTYYDVIIKAVNALGYHILPYYGNKLIIGDIHQRREYISTIRDVFHFGEIVLRNKLDGQSNVLGLQLIDDISNRYSKYIVQGTSESSNGWGKDKVNFSKTATDSELLQDYGLYREKRIQFNDNSVSAENQAINAREYSNRNSYNLRYIVSGYKSIYGSFYKLNQKVKIEDDYLGISEYFFIKGIRYLFDQAQGSRTEITVAPEYRPGLNV